MRFRAQSKKVHRHEWICLNHEVSVFVGHTVKHKIVFKKITQLFFCPTIFRIILPIVVFCSSIVFRSIVIARPGEADPARQTSLTTFQARPVVSPSKLKSSSFMWRLIENENVEIQIKIWCSIVHSKATSNIIFRKSNMTLSGCNRLPELLHMLTASCVCQAIHTLPRPSFHLFGIRSTALRSC